MLLSKFPHIELEHDEQNRQDIEMNYVKHFPPPPWQPRRNTSDRAMIHKVREGMEEEG